jgi:hypothetical protein
MRTYFRMRLWFGMLAGLATFPMLAFGQNFDLSPTFAGHAVALQLTPWKGDPVALAETGPAPPNGGQRENSLRDTPPDSDVDAHLLYAITLGASSQNRSQASLSFLNVRLGSHYVIAPWVESEATAASEFLDVPTSGKSTVAGLMVDGQLVTVTGEANQTITFPDGFLVINEQSDSSSRNMGTLTVNALHLLVDGQASIIAASSTAEVINTPTPDSELQ